MNMKKFIVCLLVICICAGAIVGCGGSKIPDEMSADIYDCGVKAVKILDRYLSADLTMDEAKTELGNLHNQAYNLQEEDMSKDLYVSIDIGYAETLLTKMSDNSQPDITDSDIRTERNELAELLEID